MSCRPYNRLLFLIIILSFAFSSGCSSVRVPNAYSTKDVDQSRVKKVAVFPFHNHTNVTESSRIATSAFIAELFARGRFGIEFPGNLRSLLVRTRIIVRTGVDLDTIKLIGNRLDVDAVIFGEVEEFVGVGEKRAAVIPVVSISSRMVDARTGRILWMAQCKRTGDDYLKILDFGRVRSVAALTQKVVRDLIDTMP